MADTQLRSLDKTLIDRFESAWMEGRPQPIESCLPPEHDERYLTTLERLVEIEMELAWKQCRQVSDSDAEALLETAQKPPTVEDYVSRFRQLNNRDVLQRLVQQEYRVRHRFGDRPPADEYLQRFPELTAHGEDFLPTLVPDQTAPLQLEWQAQAGQQMGRYVLVGQQGRGGFGFVWAADDPKLGRRIALKQLSGHLAAEPAQRRRFITEARIAARLEHPGVVPVYDLEELEGDQPYYTMKLVKGQTLEDAINRFHHEPKPASERAVEQLKLLNAFLSVCHTMEYAHARGVVHRDLKPQNIVVGNYGETIVLDWGLAKVVDREAATTDTAVLPRQQPDDADVLQTRPGTVQGTPAYMSPEQAAGETGLVDERSDIYALGVILYRLLVDRLPFEGESASEVLKKVCQDRPPPLRSVRRQVPRPLAAICETAMARERSNRYQSVATLARDVEHFLAHEPVDVYHESAIERAGRFARRHRTLVASSLVAVLLLGVAAVVAVIWWQRVEQADQQRLVELRAAAEAAESSALAELRESRFAAALELLTRGTELLQNEPQLGQLHEELETRRRRVQRIVEFYRLVEMAEERTFFDAIDDAAIYGQGALHVIGALDDPDWWTQLPEADLTPVQQQRLQQDIYRQLLLLYAMRLKQSLPESITFATLFQMGDPRYREPVDSAYAIGRLIERYRPAESVDFGNKFCRMRLGKQSEDAKLPSWHPKLASDDLALGSIMFVAAATNRGDVELVLKAVTGFQQPAEEGRKMLQAASRSDPGHYWTHIFLGWAELSVGEFDAAERNCGRAIAVRPDDWMGYLLRAQVFLAQARSIQADTDATEQTLPDLVRLALRDLERARDLQPYSPYVYWYRAQTLAMLPDQQHNVVDALIRMMELERPLELSDDPHLKVLTQQRMRNVRQFAREQITAGQETNRDVLLALAELHLGNHAEALAVVSRVLEARPDDARMLAARGAARLKDGLVEEALADFQTSQSLKPDYFAAAFGIAGALAAKQQWNEALAAYRNALQVASADWQKVVVLFGQCRMQMQLQRPDDAVRTLNEALAIDLAANTSDLRRLADVNRADSVLQRLEQHKEHLSPKLPDAAAAIRHPALLNNGFEMGLADAWGIGPASEGKPIWFNSGGCHSFAEVTSTTKRSGRMSLHIRNDSSTGLQAFGMTEQAVPITPGVRYQISAWARANSLADNGVYLSVDENSDMRPIKLPGGTYDWTHFRGEFQLNENMAIVRIVCQDAGEVWLDDIAIEAIEQ